MRVLVGENPCGVRRDLALRVASTKCEDRADASPMRGLPASGKPIGAVRTAAVGRYSPLRSTNNKRSQEPVISRLQAFLLPTIRNNNLFRSLRNDIMS